MVLLAAMAALGVVGLLRTSDPLDVASSPMSAPSGLATSQGDLAQLPTARPSLGDHDADRQRDELAGAPPMALASVPAVAAALLAGVVAVQRSAPVTSVVAGTGSARAPPATPRS